MSYKPGRLMFSKKSLLCYLFLHVTFCHSQTYKNLDSLLIEYNKRPIDTIKVNLADEILQNLTYTDPERAYKFGHNMVNMSKKLNYKSGIARGLNQISSYFFNRDELDSAYYYTKATLDMVTQIQNIGGILTANTRFANLYERQNDFDLAKQYLNKNIEIYVNKDTVAGAREIDFKFIGSTYYTLSEINIKQGRYKLALKNGLQALKEYRERAKNPLFIADAHTLLGEVEMKLENYLNSIDHFEKAYPVYEEFEDLLWQSEVFRLIAESLIHLNKNEEAIGYLQKSIRISNENNFQLKEASAYNLVGEAYINLKNYPEALNNLEKSLEVFSKMDNSTEINQTYISLGKLYNETEKVELALPYLQRAIAISDSLESLPRLSEALFTRSSSYRKTGNYEGALNDFMDYHRIMDTIFNDKKSQQIEEMRALFDMETKEQQIALQNQEIALLREKKRNDLLLKIILTIGILLSLLAYYAIRQKLKRNELAKQKLDADLAFKRKELTTHALHLAKKNELLESLKQKAKTLKEKEPTKSGYQQLIHTINFDLQDDNNWENFSRYFQEVHKDFNQNVKLRYPQITSNELRLLALLKMNLSSKEIANILNISQEGIKKARYRLRKKLDITSEESLQDLVLSL